MEDPAQGRVELWDVFGGGCRDNPRSTAPTNGREELRAASASAFPVLGTAMRGGGSEQPLRVCTPVRTLNGPHAVGPVVTRMRRGDVRARARTNEHATSAIGCHVISRRSGF